MPRPKKALPTGPITGPVGKSTKQASKKTGKASD